MKNLFASMFLQAAAASVPDVAQGQGADFIQAQHITHTLNFGGYSYGVEFQGMSDASGYRWNSLNDLIEDSFSGLTLWQGFGDPSQIGGNMRIVREIHQSNYNAGLTALAANVVDHGNADILTQGADPLVVEMMMESFNGRSRLEKIDQVAARIGRWLDRHEDWQGYLAAHNAHVDIPIDVLAFGNVANHHKSYEASSVLSGMIGGSPQYQPFRNQSLNSVASPTTRSP